MREIAYGAYACIKIFLIIETLLNQFINCSDEKNDKEEMAGNQEVCTIKLIDLGKENRCDTWHIRYTKSLFG